jgi:hypothetical protein
LANSNGWDDIYNIYTNNGDTAMRSLFKMTDREMKIEFNTDINTLTNIVCQLESLGRSIRYNSIPGHSPVAIEKVVSQIKSQIKDLDSNKSHVNKIL